MLKYMTYDFETVKNVLYIPNKQLTTYYCSECEYRERGTIGVKRFLCLRKQKFYIKHGN